LNVDLNVLNVVLAKQSIVADRVAP